MSRGHKWGASPQKRGRRSLENPISRAALSRCGSLLQYLRFLFLSADACCNDDVITFTGLKKI